MEKLICNACGVEKVLSSYYRCKECKHGVMKICKMCKLSGKTSQKADDYIHPFNLDFRKTEEQHYSLQGCTKEDYMEMYRILTLMGYDVNKGDIHRQFLDRYNPTLEKPMKYKKRKGKLSFFLPDGSIAPQKKTPTNE